MGLFALDVLTWTPPVKFWAPCCFDEEVEQILLGLSTIMETGSVSSIPSSSISNTSARSTPTPNPYKPLTPSASLLALTKIPDDDLRRRNMDDLVQLIRRLEAENRNLVAEHGNMIKDVNKKMQILLLEIRGLKDVNQNLQDDNQELRDLCCFLDDDRQRGRKLAREWQRFGRYTASVMRSEVSAYQEKLKELEEKQQELISDNLELKELCLYLDQERLRAIQPRDEGDGSSSSTVAGNEEPQGQNDIELVPVSQLTNTDEQIDNDAATNEYIRQLEEKVRSLEKEKKKMTKLGWNAAEHNIKETPFVQVTGTQRVGPDGNQAQDASGTRDASPNKPEAVVHAMKVLEVHENLERPQTSVGEDNTLDDKEKAIVREMCNVVWRKLGSVKAEQQEAQQPVQPPVYENLQPQPARSKSTPPEATGVRVDPGGYSQGSPESRYYTNPETQYRPESEHQGQYRSAAEPAVVTLDQPTAYIQRMGNSKGHTVFQVTPSYPGQDFRRYEESEARSQTQRPPPGPESQAYGALGNPQYSNQQGRYGFVQTSRSTPVTPVPQQQSQAPNQRTGPTSHSPGPVRRAVTPKASDMQRSHSPGPRSQFPRSEANRPVYQNQPVHGNMGDNSYENVPSSQYYPPTLQNVTQSSHNRSLDSGGQRYGYTAPQPHALSPSPYPVHSASSSKISSTYSGYHPPPSHTRPPAPNSQSLPYYQNMPVRNSNPPQSTRNPNLQDSIVPYQGATPTPVMQRNAPPSQSYTQNQPMYAPATNYQNQPVSASSPPGYNNPPQYQNRRTSYIEARENDDAMYSGKRDMNHYYR